MPKCSGVFLLVHDTRFNNSRSTMHNACINYASMLTLYRDNSCIKGRKNIIVISKDLVSLAQKILNKVDQKRNSDAGVFL